MVQSVLLEQSKEEEIFYLLDHQLWTVGLLIGRVSDELKSYYIYDSVQS